jgi:L-ascorbate metabolism protein UlaG (beta-lactamase superfamily)
MTQNIEITWLGHSTFRIDTAGKTIVIDPWVNANPMCPEKNKKFEKLDLMLCTHGHGDHIGDAVPLIKQHQPKVVGIFELCIWLGKKGAKNVMPMNKGGSQTLEGVKVTMVHADHSCGIQEDDGTIIYGGEACGYVLEFENGLKLYHAGDTNVFGDMHIIRELYAPDVACLPIGDLFTMGPREVAYACQLLRPKVVVPMHFGTFPALTGNPRDLEKVSEDLGIHVMALKPGERTSLEVKHLAPMGK